MVAVTVKIPLSISVGQRTRIISWPGITYKKGIQERVIILITDNQYIPVEVAEIYQVGNPHGLDYIDGDKTDDIENDQRQGHEDIPVKKRIQEKGIVEQAKGNHAGRDKQGGIHDILKHDYFIGQKIVMVIVGVEILPGEQEIEGTADQVYGKGKNIK